MKWKTLLKQPNGHGNSSSNNGGNSSEDRIYDGGSDKHHKQIHQTCYTRVSLFITEIFTSILGYIIDIHSSKLTVAARILHAGLQHGNSQRWEELTANTNVNRSQEVFTFEALSIGYKKLS